jgi:hypothetical protein
MSSTSLLRFGSSPVPNSSTSPVEQISIVTKLQDVEHLEHQLRQEYITSTESAGNWSELVQPVYDDNNIHYDDVIEDGKAYRDVVQMSDTKPIHSIGLSPKRISEFLVREQYAVINGRSPPLDNPPDIFKNFNWSNVILAGGAVSRALLNNASGDFDYDFYIYGLNPDDAKKRLATLLKHFFTFHDTQVKTNRKLSTISNIRIIRSKTAITLNWGIGPRNIQICLTLARDPLELLLTFDLAPCKVAYQDGKLYMTPSARLAYQTGYFGLGINARELCSGNVVTRVNKYLQRGFRAYCLSMYFKVEVGFNNNNIPQVRSKDLIYNVIDTEELEILEDGRRSGFDVETEVARQYKENPVFIAMRYSSNTKDCYPYLGACWDLYTPSIVWHFLNHAKEYVEHLRVTSDDGTGIVRTKAHPKLRTGEICNHNLWVGIPDPDLPDQIEFVTVPELIKYVTTSRINAGL